MQFNDGDIFEKMRVHNIIHLRIFYSDHNNGCVFNKKTDVTAYGTRNIHLKHSGRLFSREK